jgi:hypothetical protein
MKKFIYLTVVLMLILVSFGCATVSTYTPSGTQKTQDLSSTVGNRPFIGVYSRGTLDLNGWNPMGGY